MSANGALPPLCSCSRRAHAAVKEKLAVCPGGYGDHAKEKETREEWEKKDEGQGNYKISGSNVKEDREALADSGIKHSTLAGALLNPVNFLTAKVEESTELGVERIYSTLGKDFQTF